MSTVENNVPSGEQASFKKVAIVVDNVVTRVMSIDDATEAALLSDPIIVGLGFNIDRIGQGDIYDPTSKTFTKPEQLAADAANNG